MDEIDLIQASMLALVSYLNANDPYGFKKVIDTLLYQERSIELRRAFEMLAASNADRIKLIEKEKKLSTN